MREYTLKSSKAVPLPPNYATDKSEVKTSFRFCFSGKFSFNKLFSSLES